MDNIDEDLSHAVRYQRFWRLVRGEEETSDKEKPYPVVISPSHRKPRRGRGFSISELKAVGLQLSRAKRLGIPVDKRRKSCREENIQILRDFLRNLELEGDIEGVTSKKR